MRSFATYTRSGSATTDTTDVSLIRKIVLAARGGTETASAWGSATKRRTCAGLSPSDAADSHWMGATESRPARRASAMYAPPRKTRPTTAQVSPLHFTPTRGSPK